MTDGQAVPQVDANSPAPAGPCLFVVFGATGDLTKRKLMPSLYNLAQGGHLSENFAVIGVAFDELSTDEFRRRMTEEDVQYQSNKIDPAVLERFASRMHYVKGDFHDPDLYRRLGETISQVDHECQTGGNCLFYLAISPTLFGEVVRQLGAAGLTREGAPPAGSAATDMPAHGWRRVIVEKPFGRDLESAAALNRELGSVLDESQIYRIDHYLGKETVQNILVFRFANGIFEPIWNHRYIDHVRITVAESLGVEERGGYYDHSGALRDMIPNHLFQLVAMVGMESPISFDADAVRDEKAKVLRAIHPLAPEDVLQNAVRGQYGAGKIGDRQIIPYRSAPQVAPDSHTETFVALRLMIDNWRWAGVPFYLRTGKCLPERVTEVVIQFKRAPFSLFRGTPVEHLAANQLVLRIQPDEGISLRFAAKLPGLEVRTGGVNMDFSYEDYFGGTTMTGYETLIYDCMIGDATLFQRDDFVMAGWSVVQPVIDVWQSLPPRDFPNYTAGTWGPPAAEKLWAAGRNF
ncbi:MAG: glucose-6-phosphate dehydrogenase [Pirellulales bacterium]|nr:glucose-6-phosphate dehydrogenase [Pirellulales bacterium]